jgi:uncharacterized membrane protein
MITLPAPMALVFGQTGLILATSVVSAFALASGAAAVFLEGDLSVFVLGLAVGEFLTVLWVLATTIRIYKLTPALAWFGTLFPVAVLCGAHLSLAQTASDDMIARTALFLGGSVVLAIAYIAALAAQKLPLIPASLRGTRSARVEPSSI